MSPFGRPRVESRVSVRVLSIMPDRNERLISYVPMIQSYTGHHCGFFKKGEITQDLAADSLPPCHFSCFAGAQQATPQEGHSRGPTLTSVTWLPCSSSPPPLHRSDAVGAGDAPSSQLHVKMQVRHESCHPPWTIPPNVWHVNKKAPYPAWSWPGTFPNFLV